jgi:hypothetical protein
MTWLLILQTNHHGSMVSMKVKSSLPGVKETDMNEDKIKEAQAAYLNI